MCRFHDLYFCKYWMYLLIRGFVGIESLFMDHAAFLQLAITNWLKIHYLGTLCSFCKQIKNIQNQLELWRVGVGASISLGSENFNQKRMRMQRFLKLFWLQGISRKAKWHGWSKDKELHGESHLWFPPTKKNILYEVESRLTDWQNADRYN